MASVFLSTVVMAILNALPWIAIALVALMSLMRAKHSKALWMQVIGANCLFGLWTLRWLASVAMRATSVSPSMVSFVGAAFELLTYVMLVVFAIGYCVERLTQKRDAAGFPVTATRVG